MARGVWVSRFFANIPATECWVNFRHRSNSLSLYVDGADEGADVAADWGRGGWWCVEDEFARDHVVPNVRTNAQRCVRPWPRRCADAEAVTAAAPSGPSVCQCGCARARVAPCFRAGAVVGEWLGGWLFGERAPLRANLDVESGADTKPPSPRVAGDCCIVFRFPHMCVCVF